MILARVANGDLHAGLGREVRHRHTFRPAVWRCSMPPRATAHARACQARDADRGAAPAVPQAYRTLATLAGRRASHMETVLSPGATKLRNYQPSG